MTDANPSGPLAVCVLGMHRSGTSALARLVNLLGVDLSEDLLGGQVDNPKGFWEQKQILAAHTDLLEAVGSFFDDYLPLPAGWELRPEIAPHRRRLLDVLTAHFGGKPLWGFKDPRTCRLLPLWHELFAAMGVGPRFALVVRSPDEIAKSLAVRNGYSYNKSLLLTLVHMLEAERHTRGRRRVVVAYDEILADGRATAAKVGEGLGVRWPRSFDDVAGQVADFLDPNLRHHKSDKATTAEQAVRLRGADPDAARWAFGVFDLLSAARDSAAVDEAAVDRVYAEFRDAIPRLSAWRQLRSVDQKFMQVEAWGLRLNATVQHLARDNDDLRLELAKRPPAAALTGPGEAGRTSPDSPGTPPAGAHPGVDPRDVALAALEATNRALRISAEGADRDLQVLRDAVTQRDALIVQLQTRERELDLAYKWLLGEKDAADREMQRRAEAVRLLEEERDKSRAEVRWTAEQKSAADRELAARALAVQGLEEDRNRLREEIRWLTEQKAAVEEDRNRLAEEVRWLTGQKAAADAELENRARAVRDVEAEAAGLRAWTAELSSGRDWLAEENRRLGDWARKLESDKAWLTDRMERLAEELKARDALVAELRSGAAPRRTRPTRSPPVDPGAGGNEFRRSTFKIVSIVVMCR